jgi:hypothetical protein
MSAFGRAVPNDFRTVAEPAIVWHMPTLSICGGGTERKPLLTAPKAWRRQSLANEPKTLHHCKGLWKARVMSKASNVVAGLVDVVIFTAPCVIFIAAFFPAGPVRHLVVVSAAIAFACTPFVLTAIGARRRGNDLLGCVVQALVFPVSWIAWFVADNHRAGRGAFSGK